MKASIFFFYGIFLLSWGAGALAQPVSVRWTGKEDPNSNLIHILDVIRAKTGIELSQDNFMVLESRNLATSHFLMLGQTTGGVPIRGLSLRIWTKLDTNDVIQVEAQLDKDPKVRNPLRPEAALTSVETMQLVRTALKESDDPFIRKIQWQDMWEKGRFIRVVKVNGKRGKHEFTFELNSKNVLNSTYQEFPQADVENEINLPVKVFPVYEEAEEAAGQSNLLPRIESQLRHIQTKIRVSLAGDPLAALKAQHYEDTLYDPLLGLTVEGRKQGFWSMTFIRDQANRLFAQLPRLENSFENGGVYLEGKYATVSLYPQAAKLPNLNFSPAYSPHFRPDFVPSEKNPGGEEMIPAAAVYGRPIASFDEAMNRPARRLPDHDPSSYANDGFDEIQVYWAVNQMFESLKASGFTDPELSTRPFNAFLFNPDITYRDNAFYTDDTINFTTYSPNSSNMARDNTTIWHELGHGVMDRLMGEHIQLADTGGLSEGMADFVAQLVLNDVTGGLDFPGKQKMRIFNQTGYYFTNEVHDDGEAYGGSMNDILLHAMARFGKAGLTKVTDLTMETMRLTRNHPGLTAIDWFQHMLFADEMGRAGIREPGELRSAIIQALNGRNFNLDGVAPAMFTLKNANEDVLSGSPGSRNNPIKVRIKEGETQKFNLEVALRNSPTYQFKFPVTVKVNFTGGALEGGVHWLNEEAGNLSYTLNSDADVAKFSVGTDGKCDLVNRPDGSCVDYVYVQIWNQQESKKPQAKKRFYLRVYPQATGKK